MANGTLILRMSEQDMRAVEAVIGECSLEHIDAKTQIEATFRMAAGMRQLRKLITEDAMKDVMELQNSSLGFRTDKAQGGYGVETVKDVIIEACLRGLRPVGNEINIISGRMYVTKEGFARLVREFPGLTDLKLSPAVPRMRDGGALVTYKATWRRNGLADVLEREFPVRVNTGMGSDAIIGKATRKMLAAIYGQLTGSEHALPEGEVDDVIEGQASERTSKSALTDQLPTPTKDTPEPPPELQGNLIDDYRAALSAATDIESINQAETAYASMAGSDSERGAIAGMAQEARDAKRKPKKQTALAGT